MKTIPANPSELLQFHMLPKQPIKHKLWFYTKIIHPPPKNKQKT